MSIADKLKTIADNVQKVYDAGRAAGGGDDQFTAYVSGTLENVVIPEGVTEIRERCFMYQTLIKSVQFPSTLITIGFRSFTESGLSGTLVIPASVEYIHEEAFSYLYDNVKEVIFMGTPRYLDMYAFLSSFGITSIKVPWEEGAVNGAPWNAFEATIEYNYLGE